MSQSIPPVALLVSHNVADYDVWKKAFDDHQSARKEAGCLGHDVHRGIDDPDRVTIYNPAGDVDKLKAFLEGPDLSEAMQSAGVQGVPTVTLMKPMSAEFTENRLLPGIVVTHDVEDYSRWRTAYDDFDAHRKQVGIVGHAVNQLLGNPNRVVIYHQAETADTLRAFLESAKLKEVMQSAGVVGAPDIQLVQAVDIAEY